MWNSESYAHKGTVVSIGSYVTVSTPGYKASLVSSRDAWRGGRVSVAGRTVTLEAKLPKGTLTYSATVASTDPAFQITNTDTGLALQLANTGGGPTLQVDGESTQATLQIANSVPRMVRSLLE